MNDKALHDVTVPEADVPAAELDRADPLAGFRSEFHIPPAPDGGEKAYFCGHSLGLQPKGVQAAVEAQLEDWRRLAVDAHFDARHRWLDTHKHVREPIARLVGAKPAEVVTMNALTVNLHLMMVSFYRPQPGRHRIVIERGAFPSDRYAVVSQIEYHGYDPNDALIELDPEPGERCLRHEAIEAVLRDQGESVALVMLPGVQYYTGQAFDLARITGAAHAAGATVGFDLAHAVGNVPVALHDSGCDFAVWCTYKYLNAGPGSTAGCFIHERHLGRHDLPRFAGWWGQEESKRFEMGPHFEPPDDADAWHISNLPILSTTPVRVSLEVFERAGFQALRAKSVRMTGWLERLINERLGDYLEIFTPAAPEERGCHLSLRFKGQPSAGRELYEALKARGILCDWREPDCMRIAPVPLYNSFGECERFVEATAAILQS